MLHISHSNGIAWKCRIFDVYINFSFIKKSFLYVEYIYYILFINFFYLYYIFYFFIYVLYYVSLFFDTF